MHYCNLQLLLCTEITAQEDFAPPQIGYDFWRDLEGGAKKNFLGSLSLAIFYVPIINYDIIRPMPQTPSRLGGCPLHIPHPSRRLRHLAPRRLIGASSLVTLLFRPKLRPWLGPRPPTS